MDFFLKTKSKKEAQRHNPEVIRIQSIPNSLSTQRYFPKIIPEIKGKINCIEKYFRAILIDE